MISSRSLYILSFFSAFLVLESNVAAHPPSLRPRSRLFRFSPTTKPSKTPITSPPKKQLTPPKQPTSSYPPELLRRSSARLPSPQRTFPASSPQEWVEQLRRNRAIKRCYERSHQRFRDIRLQSLFPLRLVISAKGRVVQVRVGTATGKQHPIVAVLERCLLRGLRWAHFRTGGRTATLIYPISSDSSR